MSLFRRLRRDKEDEAAAEESGSTKPSPPVAEPPPVAPTPAPAEPAPAAAEPARIPPPLPDRPTAPAAPAVPASDPLTKCFVCGTPLEGHTCPTCQMTWTE